MWQDSQECSRIQESAHFARACAQVVQLRRELAAALDYERLSSRAAELRKGLAKAPIVATSDPLPAAFSATLGRLLPLGGAEGVALLLTIVVELISCCGLAGLSALYRGRVQEGPGTPGRAPSLEAEGASLSTDQRPSAAAPVILPKPSLRAVASGRTNPRERRSREASDPPSNVLPMRPRTSSQALPEGALPALQSLPCGGLPEAGSHVPRFVQQRLQTAKGKSIAAKELRSVYEAVVRRAGSRAAFPDKACRRAQRVGI